MKLLILQKLCMSRVRSGQKLWPEKWFCRLKLQKRTERKRARGKQTSEGRPRAIPVRSPLKTKTYYFFIMNDLPCKRTRHGKGRMTKNYQDSSSIKEAKSRYLLHPQSLIYSFWPTLSDAFIIYDTRYSFHRSFSIALLHRIDEQISAEIINIYSNQPLHLQHRLHKLLALPTSNANSEFIPVRMDRNAFVA